MWSLIWNSGIVNPMTNLLLYLVGILDSFFLALIVFTALTRLVMLPLNLRQQRSMAKTQEMQPQVQAIQKKYRNDPQKMQEEFKKIGYNPAESLAGCLPLLIQMPIFFGLYRAILYVLSATPQGLFELSERAYSSINLTELLPISNSFLWMNLAQPDPLFVLPILVGGSMYLQQKLLMPNRPKTEQKKGEPQDPTAAMQQSMQVTMPLMFGFFALQFPSGLSIYFVVANLIGMVQGFYMRNQREKAKAEREAQKQKKKQPVIVEPSEDSVEASLNGQEAHDSKPKKKEYVPPSERKQSKRKKRRK